VQFGPELTALMAYLTVVCSMLRRVVLELADQRRRQVPDLAAILFT
jgi:hypothetical protein